MHMLSLGDDPLLGYLGGLGFRVRVFRGLGLEGEVWFGGFGDVGDACEFGGLHAAEALHAAHGVLGELAGQDGGAEAVLVAGHGAALEGVLEVLVLLAAAQLREAAALVAAPGGLDEGGGPGAPVVGVVPEGVLQLFAVEAPELAGDELEVVRGEREGLHLHDRLDGVGGDGQVTLRLGIQRPCQQLLPTKVPRFQHPVVEEPRPATVRRHALQRPPDDEQHLVHRVALAQDDGALGAQRRLQPLAHRVQQALVHLVKERHLREQDVKTPPKKAKPKTNVVMKNCKRGLDNKLTFRTRLRQRWRLMSLRRSDGRLCTSISSFTPRVATHLYWS
jgi:hypothetical protein